MRINLPGLLQERTPSGAIRWRVRVAGNKSRRITLKITPNHPAFTEHYHAARQGVTLPPPDDSDGISGSIGWLVAKFQGHMRNQVAAGNLDASTESYRVRHTNILRKAFGEYHAKMPQAKLLDLRDTMQDRPATADTFIKSVRAMYAWGIERGHASTDPTAGIKRIVREEVGATPWTVADLKAYRERHPFGTMAHLYITLLTFTACRIGDAVSLGRSNEVKREGRVWIEWTAEKKGALPVAVPMAPQLYDATRAQTVQGPTYILNANGTPFASKDALSNRFSKWVQQAGLKGRSSHGVRKAAGALMAEAGMSQHIIMAIHGHSEAKTSEIYTRSADRRALADEGMKALAKLDW